MGPIGLEEEPIGLFFTIKRKEKNCAKPHGCSVLRARVCTEIWGSSLSIAVKSMLHRIQREQLWCLNSISYRNLKRRKFTISLHANFSSVWKWYFLRYSRLSCLGIHEPLFHNIAAEVIYWGIRTSLIYYLHEVGQSIHTCFRVFQWWSLRVFYITKLSARHTWP